MKIKSKFSKYVGDTINRLTIKNIFKDGKGNIRFVCQCSCGKFTEPRAYRVVGDNPQTKSCGCYSTELAAKRASDTPSNILPEGQSAFNAIYSQYKSNAKRREYNFLLKKENFKNIIDSKCSYCGAPPSNEMKTKGGNYTYNGIDRLDNSVGYEIDNCIPCCTRCNFFKGSMDSEGFLELIDTIKTKNIIKNGINEKKLDSYYRRALAAAEDSPDEQTKVGSILINKDSGAVIASGFNGFVRGADDKKLPKTRPEKYKYIVHSEQNLIFNCVRHGISTRNCAIFVTLSPCQGCTRALYQSGITTVYFKDKYRDFDEQISLGDLKVDITQVGEYTKVELLPNKEYKE